MTTDPSETDKTRDLTRQLLRIDVNGLDPYTSQKTTPLLATPMPSMRSGVRISEPVALEFRPLDRDTIGDVGEGLGRNQRGSAGSAGGLNWMAPDGRPHVLRTRGGLRPRWNELPIFSYPHENGWCSVIGGYRYRGGEIPTLYGSYVFTDACGFYDVKFWSLTEQADGTWVGAPLDIQVPDGFVPWDETRFAFSENSRGELTCARASTSTNWCTTRPINPAGELADALRFTPNPVVIGNDVVLDVGQCFSPPAHHGC